MMRLHGKSYRQQIHPFTQGVGCTDNRMLNPSPLSAFVRCFYILFDISLKAKLVFSSIVPEPSHPRVSFPFLWRKLLGQSRDLIQMFSEFLPMIFIGVRSGMSVEGPRAHGSIPPI
jgi:hypothetical protein